MYRQRGADTFIPFKSGLESLTRLGSVFVYAGILYTSYSAWISASIFESDAEYLFIGDFSGDGTNMPIAYGFEYEVLDKVINYDATGNFVYRIKNVNPNYKDKNGENKLWLDGVQVLRYSNQRILKIG